MLKERSDNFDGFYIFFLTIMLIGLYLDAYANYAFPTRRSEFFAYWNIITILGYSFASLTLILPTLINFLAGKSIRESIPLGYQYALLGSVLFAIGSIAQYSWIKNFSPTYEIELIFNPPSTIIGIGAFLMFSGPILTMKAYPIENWNDQLTILLPLIYMTADILLYTQFASPFNYISAGEGYEPRILETANLAIQTALIGFIFVAIILTASYIFILRNWNLLPGSTFLYFFVIITLLSTIRGYYAFILLAFSVACLMESLYLMYLMNEPEYFEEAIAIFLPLAMYSLYFVLMALTIGLSWGTNLWASVILMSIAANLILAILMKSSM